MTNHTYSEEGLALTKRFEGLRLTAYQDLRGIWTIGYGHTGPDVHTELCITEADAEALLEADLSKAVACVNRLVTTPVAQNQFDALVDFAFNLGCSALSRSTLLAHINAGDFAAAAGEFLRWDHAGDRTLPGLRRRRRAEVEMFEGGVRRQ